MHATSLHHLGKDDDHIGTEAFKFAADQSFGICPIETIAVTAAMPMTTPRIVSAARIRFLASDRREYGRNSRAHTVRRPTDSAFSQPPTCHRSSIAVNHFGPCPVPDSHGHPMARKNGFLKTQT